MQREWTKKWFSNPKNTDLFCDLLVDKFISESAAKSFTKYVVHVKQPRTDTLNTAHDEDELVWMQ